MKKLLTIIGLALATVAGGTSAQAQLFWNTNNSSATLTATNWGTSAGGPFTTAWSNNSSIVFTANSRITNVTNTPVGNLTVSGGSTVTWTSAGTFNTGNNVRTFDIGTGSTLTWGGQNVAATGGTGFIKDGAGVWNIGAQGNQYGGGFTLNAGTIIAGGVNAMGGGASGVLNLNGGVVASNGNRSFDNTRFGGGITIGGNVQFGELATVVSAASSTATLAFANNVSLGASTRTLTIGNNGTTTFSGNITGGGGLTVSRNAGTSGAIVLSGSNNAYTGATTVTGGGRLAITGASSISTSSGISIGNEDGTELDVTGVTSTFTLRPDTTFTLGTTTASNGLINATGKILALNSTTLTLNTLGSFSEGTYSFNLFDFSSTTGTIGSFVLTGAYTGTFSSLTSQSVGNAAFTFNDVTGVLSVTAVPEPHEYALMMAGLLGVIIMIRRMRRNAVTA